MNIKIINNLYTDENTYIVYDENGIGFVIDPGNSDAEIAEKCEQLGVMVDKIILTHCHYDHMEYVEELRKRTKAQLVCGKECADNIKNPKINLTMAGLGRNIICEDAEIVVSDGENIKIGEMDIKCIHTPGHTNCSYCFLVENTLFAGDTLFLRNCGRWDLPTGDMNSLLKSVKEKLYTLPDETVVYSGHGEKTSIGYEKKFNFIIK